MNSILASNLTLYVNYIALVIE